MRRRRAPDPAITLTNVAQIAVQMHGHPRAAQALASQQARRQTDDPEAVEVSEIFVRVIGRALMGFGATEALAPIIWEGTSSIAEVAIGAWRSEDCPCGPESPAQALAATFWVVDRAENFQDAMRLALRIDARGSTGLAVGQLGGALWPEEATALNLPNGSRWL